MKQERVAIFPGSFDPITYGHLDVIERGAKMFDRLIVAIGHNPMKKQMFSPIERIEMIQSLVSEIDPPVEVEAFTGLTVDFATKVGAQVILRGVRNFTDLQYEAQLALTNRALGDIETVLVIAGREHGYTSSSLIRQIAAGGQVERLNKLLPPIIIEKMKTRQLVDEEDPNL